MKSLAALGLAALLATACSSNPAPTAPTDPAPSGSVVAPITTTPTASSTPDAAPPMRMCTMEVKLCPDGTEVGRTGPNCEFSPCPEGKSCTSSSDCASGELCHGEAGCDAKWVCVKSRPCTKDLVSYCGCDGKAFQSSGSCPGKKYKSKGGC